jgi:hypothetical protein
VTGTTSLRYRGLPISFTPEGYFCQIPVRNIAIDADGAPDAYGPASAEHPEGCGTDTLSSAGYPTAKDDPIPDRWQDVLVPDPTAPDEPYLNGRYYISKTSLFDPSVDSDLAPGKFVDANQVAYIVMPNLWLTHLGVQLGDLCLLWHARINQRVVAIVADACPIDEPLGEMSIAAAVNLGGRNVSPRTGVDFPGNGRIYCHIFKQSRPKLFWPLTNAFVQSFRPRLEAMIAR